MASPQLRPLLHADRRALAIPTASEAACRQRTQAGDVIPGNARCCVQHIARQLLDQLLLGAGEMEEAQSVTCTCKRMAAVVRGPGMHALQCWADKAGGATSLATPAAPFRQTTTPHTATTTQLAWSAPEKRSSMRSRMAHLGSMLPPGGARFAPVLARGLTPLKGPPRLTAAVQGRSQTGFVCAASRQDAVHTKYGPV